MLNRLKPKSEFSRNVLTLMTGTTIAQAIPMAISPILTRIYTPAYVGVFALYMSLVYIIGIIILSTFLYLGLKFDDQFLIYITFIYIASILGYFYFNWSPAKIFTGDSGSLSIGLVISLVAIYSINMHYVSTATVLMLAALPVLDTFIVMTRRVLSGKSPFVADKLHIHHIVLKQQKNNTRRTVFILGLIQTIFSYIGFGFKIRDDILILFLFLLLFILFYIMLAPKQQKKRDL